MKISYYLIKSLSDDDWFFGEFNAIRGKDNLSLWIANGPFFLSGSNKSDCIRIPLPYRFIVWHFIKKSRNKVALKLIKGEK